MEKPLRKLITLQTLRGTNNVPKPKGLEPTSKQHGEKEIANTPPWPLLMTSALCTRCPSSVSFLVQVDRLLGSCRQATGQPHETLRTAGSPVVWTGTAGLQVNPMHFYAGFASSLDKKFSKCRTGTGSTMCLHL